MIVKDLIRHDCFVCDFINFEVLSWVHVIGGAEPMIVVRHCSGLVGAISKVEESVRAIDYDLYFRLCKENWKDASRRDAKAWRAYRKIIRSKLKNLCPQPHPLVRSLLLDYKRGIQTRKGFRRPGSILMYLNGFVDYREASCGSSSQMKFVEMSPAQTGGLPF